MLFSSNNTHSQYKLENSFLTAPSSQKKRKILINMHFTSFFAVALTLTGTALTVPNTDANAVGLDTRTVCRPTNTLCSKNIVIL
jgi:hypothetical protein